MISFHQFIPLLLIGILCNRCTTHYYCTSTEHIQKEYIVIQQQTDIDSAIYKTILPYKTKIDEELNTPIAFTSQAIEKNAHCHTLAELVFESIKYYADSILPKNTSYSVLINNGGLRANIPPGTISKRHIYELMPFDNKIVILELTSSQWTELLEKSKDHSKLLLKSTGSAAPQYLITSDYLYQGGDDCGFLKSAKSLHQKNPLIRDCIIHYCRIQKQLTIPCFY